MQEEYLPHTLEGCLAHVSEEAAEVIQAISKAQRFGIDNGHPNGTSSNLQEIITEYQDFHAAMMRLLEKVEVSTK